MKAICSIAILTHNGSDRPHLFKKCIESLTENTNLSPDWFDIQIFCDGTNPEIIKAVYDAVLKLENSNASVKDTIFTTERFGCGKMVNLIWEYTKKYKYTFFLESDWMVNADVPLSWLIDLVKFMDKHEMIDSTILRKYLSPTEMRQFSAITILHNPANWVTDVQLPYMKFPGMIVVDQIYSNNPHIRRNQSYEDVLPLDIDENSLDVKGSVGWSKSEQSAENRLRKKMVLYPRFGIFSHIEFVENEGNVIWKNAPICPFCSNRCQWDFTVLVDKWCEFCKGDKSKSLSKIEEDFINYIKEVELNK